MKTLSIIPSVYNYDHCKDFCSEFAVGMEDLIITSKHIYEDFLKGNVGEAKVIYLRDFGTGEPTDIMVERLAASLQGISYKRVIGIGGGTIIDVSKLFALETITPVVDLFQKKIPAKKGKELILIPSTCGTGSEITNISILELTAIHSKFGLAVDEIYADYAVLIPELLKGLPFQYFSTSSIDAFIHAIESYLSPKASRMTQMYSMKAMEIIIKGYKKIIEEGEDVRFQLAEDFLYASLYGGIAFGNAGTGAVHAMSYPFGAAFHVPHGEANYVFFHGVFKVYQKEQPNGKIYELNQFLASVLHCETDQVYDELEELFDKLIKKKSLREYGTAERQLVDFTDNVMNTQGRLMANTYFPMSREMVYSIYKSLY